MLHLYGSAQFVVHKQESCDAPLQKPSGLTCSAVTGWFFMVPLYRRTSRALAWDESPGLVPHSARGFLSDHDEVALIFYL